MSTSDKSKQRKITVYFLAAPEDEEQTKAIKKYLSPVVRNSEIPIEILSDFEIPPGHDINEYKLQLYDADIVLAFISADFINDDQTYIRTQKVIERYNNDETIMLPILVRNCMWKSTPFVNLPLLPKNTQPLNNKQFWNSEDDALTSVVNDVYESINEFSYENVEDEVVASEVVQAAIKADISDLPSEVEIEAPLEEPMVSSLTDTEAVEAEVDEDLTEKIVSETEIPDGVESLVEQIDEVVEAKKTEEPVVEKEVKKPLPQKVKPKKKTHINLDVDYRKSFYQRTLLKRGAAFIFDQFLTFVPIYFLWIVFEVITMDENAVEYAPTLISFIGFIVAYLAVCAAFESSKWKATFGKRIMKLEITQRNGDRIGFFKAFLRNILRLIVGYIYILIVPLIIQIFTFKKFKKLFHDQMTYTVVGERLKK